MQATIERVSLVKTLPRHSVPVDRGALLGCARFGISVELAGVVEQCLAGTDHPLVLAVH